MKDGPLSDSEIKEFKKSALQTNETVTHDELLLMAAMRQQQNVNVMLANKKKQFVISMKNIPVKDQNYVMDIDREKLPEKSEKEEHIIRKIKKIHKKSKAPQAEDMIAYIKESDHVSAYKVLQAMYNAASDNTPTDQVMAGIVYIVASTSNSDMAGKLLSGALHVDAVPEEKLGKLKGTKTIGAAYAATSTDFHKANTLYIPNTFKISSLIDRAGIIHELSHAEDDFEVISAKKVKSITTEIKAYKREAKYFVSSYINQARKQQIKELGADPDYEKNIQQELKDITKGKETNHKLETYIKNKKEQKQLRDIARGDVLRKYFDKKLNPIRYWAILSVLKKDEALQKQFVKHLNKEQLEAIGVEKDLKSSSKKLDKKLKKTIKKIYGSRVKGKELKVNKQGHFYHGKL